MSGWMRSNGQFFIKEPHAKHAQELLDKGDYKGVCDYVDGIFGWKPGDIKRPGGYTKEAAEFAIRSL